jgi:hypothetical protein
VKTVEALVTAELAAPVDPRVTAMAAAIAAGHGTASRAVLFYGSCLREAQLDGLMLDFYLIVSDYRAAYDKSWLATANRLIPPNVFPFAHDGLAAKYAVLSEADFALLTSAEADNVSVWARFAQPTRLVWAADAIARAAAVAAVAQAAPTLLALARPLVASDDPLDPWREGFAQTYAAELRAERSARPGSIVDADPDRYHAFADAIPHPLRPIPQSRALKRWAQLRRRGKWLSVLRIAKASFTFAGGIDYLAWKISRHSGVPVEITPWQRRWPLLGALVLVPRLLARGAIR